MAFALRAYDPSDFETLYEIDRDCYPRGIAYSRRTLRWFLEQPGGECLVAQAGEGGAGGVGPMAGFIISEAEGAEAEEGATGGPVNAEGHIITLDIVQSARRTGVGTALVGAIEQRLAARGVRRVSLETATSNEAAVAFWQRHGYRSSAVIRGYYLGRIDAYLMHKTLT
jgi:ribosomal protein S18 acetylase RimI-like enzyme